MAQADVDIPQPVTSGTTDHPDVPQSGTPAGPWEKYASTKTSAAKGPWQNYKPTAAPSARRVPAPIPAAAVTSPNSGEEANLRSNAPNPALLPPAAGSKTDVQSVMPISGAATNHMEAAPGTGSKDVVAGAWDTAGKMATAGAKAGGELMQGAEAAPVAGTQGALPEGAQGFEKTMETAHAQHPVAMGAAKAVGEMAGGMAADPRQWPLLFLGEGVVAPAIEKLISGTFAASMSKEAITGAKNLAQNWGKLTPEQRAEQVTNLGLSSAFAGMAGFHAGAHKVAKAGFNEARDLVNPVPETEDAKVLDTERATAQENYDKAKAAMDRYKYGLAQGVPAPPKVQKAFDTASNELALATFHHEAATDAANKAVAERRNPTPKPAPVAEVPAEQIEAKQQPMVKLGQKPVNVKGPGEVQPETFPQAPTERPMVTLGQRELPNNQGRMGQMKALPEMPQQLPQEVLPPERAMVKAEAPAVQEGPKTIEAKNAAEERTPVGKPAAIEQPASSMEDELTPKPPAAKEEKTPTVKPAEVEKQLNEALGNKPIEPGVPLKEQGKVSSEPRKAVLQKAGATPEEIATILPKGAKLGQTGLTRTEMSKLAEHFGVDLGQSAIGRAQGDIKAGTHIPPAEVLQKIIDAGHTPADIAKAINEGKHLPPVSGGSQATGYSQKADKRYPATSKVENRAGERRQEAVPVEEERRLGDRRNAAGIRVDEHGDPVMSADVQGHWQSSAFGEKPVEDIGAKSREKNPEPTRAETKGEAAKDVLSHANDYNKAEGLPKIKPEKVDRSPRAAENAKLSDEELLKKGFSQEDIDNGKHLPTASGGSPAAGAAKAKSKELPTGDELIKKYGESSGDPAHTTFILKDGRGVANTGSDHDMMLGGKATDKNPPREQFVADGNIRVRPRMGAGREVSLSIPESGINTKQLAYLEKMAPQLRSGAVLIEVGKPGGEYRILSHGEASTENLGKALRELAPIKNEKGSPVDENGNPTVSGGSPAAGTTEGRTKTEDEDTSFDPNRFHTSTDVEDMEKLGKKKASLKRM
jgi:hypothetical protein